MEGLVCWLEKYFMPIASKIGQQRHLKALRDGIVAMIPLLLIGSLFLIAAFPPVPFLAVCVEPYAPTLLTVVNATFDILAIVVAFSTAFSLAGSYKMDTLAAGIFSVSVFILATMPNANEFNLTLLGSKGMFVAVILAIVVVEIQRVMIKKNIMINMPEGVPPEVARSFGALIPGFVVVVVVWLLNSILLGVTGLSIHGVINQLVTIPLLSLGGNIFATILAIFFGQLLWCFGLHGTALVDGIMRPIWMTFSQQNAVAKAAGEVLPNVISQQFIETFVLIGGSGTTLALAVLLFTTAKSKQLKALGKMAIWPSIFNINEIIIFGMPIVMNPIMWVPFILAPVTCVIFTYFALTTGLVERPYAYVPWTTPAFFSGFLVTGDWRASVLQLVNFLVASLIYYPFLKTLDNAKVLEEKGKIDDEKMEQGSTSKEKKSVVLNLT